MHNLIDRAAAHGVDWQLLLLNALDAASQVLRHDARLDRLNANPLQRLGKSPQLGVTVQFRPVRQATRPSEDWCYSRGKQAVAVVIV